MRGAAAAILVLTIAFSVVAGAADAARPLAASRLYRVDPPFVEKDNGKKKDVAADLSGAACDPSGTCLAVNDQSRFAQFFVIDGDRIAAGDRKPLIGGEASAATLGAKPAAEPGEMSGGCLDEDPVFADLDGEGVAYAKPFFYVAGSHGCSRKNNEFVLSAFILARFRADAHGARIVETTYRLADALRADVKTRPFFGKRLTEAEGLNIEGLAVVGEDLIAGLRAPSIDGEAYLVSVKVDALFTPGHEPLKDQPAVIPIALGCEVGIRDLAALPDGRLLALAGPTLDQPRIPYSLFTVQPKAGGEVRQIAILEDVFDNKKRAKAEAVVVLGADPLRVLIFYDGPKNGAPREYILPK